jgi:hypothetical protein
MSEHLLVTLSTRRKYSEIPDLPRDAKYDRGHGYWSVSGGPLVYDTQFVDKRVSKKCDQETGEDQKGE